MNQFKSKKKKIVTIGGGNGSATILSALKKYKDEFDISAIVGTGDSGGSSGLLRKELNIPPPGDIMRAILAMSSVYDYKEFLKPLFYKKRFSGAGRLDGHNLGNIFLALAAQYCGDFLKAVRALEQAVKAFGRVYPSALEPADLTAELENGKIIRTEAKIDRPDYDRLVKIKTLGLDPKLKIYSGAAKAIEEADFVIFASGSLYCSVIAAILPDGFKEAFMKSKAKLIYIAGNKYELEGETGPTLLSERVWTLEKYLPHKIDVVIFNASRLNFEQKECYKQKKWGNIEYDLEKMKDVKVVEGSFEKRKGGLSANKLGKILRRQLAIDI